MSYFRTTEIASAIEGRNHYIFDLNGLILDDEHLQLEATNKAFSAFGLNISEAVWRDQCVGFKPLEYLPTMLDDSRLVHSNTDFIVNALSEKDKIYRKMVSDSGSVLLRTGMIEFLTHLKKAGCIITICTSTTQQGLNVVLENKSFSLKRFIDFCVCGDEVSRSKPDPEIYIKALKKTNFSSSKSVAFEDSRTGMLAAVRAGLDCVVCPNKFTKDQNFDQARIVVTDFSEAASQI